MVEAAMAAEAVVAERQATEITERLLVAHLAVEDTAVAVTATDMAVETIMAAGTDRVDLAVELTTALPRDTVEVEVEVAVLLLAVGGRCCDISSITGGLRPDGHDFIFCIYPLAFPGSLVVSYRSVVFSLFLITIDC